ncbi:MAG: hypothetical protein CM15mP106_1240 [Candidatus Neomarinimicrobiota bacterium]|nr:MAG: hypothetical protein CM15mP106_1240 [Candidatus Neomarinimicrobiota bacterium]
MGRDVYHEFSQTYADTGNRQVLQIDLDGQFIEKYESDGVTPGAKWVMMVDEFSWIALNLP